MLEQRAKEVDAASQLTKHYILRFGIRILISLPEKHCQQEGHYDVRNSERPGKTLRSRASYSSIVRLAF